MHPSEPFPHFVDDYLGVPAGGSPQPGESRRRPPARRPARGSEPACHRRARPRPGGVQPPPESDRRVAPHSARADRTRHRRLERRGPDVRARGGAHLGPQSSDVRRHHRHRPRGPGVVRLRARGRACPPRRVEAASGAAPRAGRSRQHQREPGHLRQDRPRELARRADVHREGSAQGVLVARRPAHSGRPRRHGERSGDGRLFLPRLPRDRSRAAGQGVVPPRSGALRAEAQTRRRHLSQRRPAPRPLPCASCTMCRRSSARWRAG